MKIKTETEALGELNNLRFASCENGARMLITLPEIAGRNFISVPMNKTNLIRGESCRGNVSARQNQPKQFNLEERTPTAPNP